MSIRDFQIKVLLPPLWTQPLLTARERSLHRESGLSGALCLSLCHPQPGRKCSLHPKTQQHDHNLTITQWLRCHTALAKLHLTNLRRMRLMREAHTVTTIYGDKHNVLRVELVSPTQQSVGPDWGHRSWSQTLKNVVINFLVLKGHANKIKLSFSFNYGILNVHK